MADTPIPRSYEQIVSDIVDSFIARTGISALKVGSPILSMIEAVAQSQMRNSQDTFNLLASQSLDHATGDALTQIAADEGLVRKNASASFGYVTFTDGAFTKVSTQLTAGASRGQSVITVNDATKFNVSNSVIIGNDVRVILAINGNVITLDGILNTLHPIGTEVVKLQSNDRVIPAGTSVGTGTINFTTVNSATIPAGYTSVANVSVVCATEGTTGNVPASTINVINSTLNLTSPTVTNPYGFINGQDQETDDELRDRVRYARRNKQKGTDQAIQNAAIGVQSPVASGESKKVISASVVDTGAGKASLYIDDGTGYEPIALSIGIETLTASATGGEKYFELQGGRPVAQCFVESTLSFPADLSTGASVGVTTTSGTSGINIPAASFADPKNVTSYELVSFINAKTNLKFVAATRDNHTKVVLYPKAQIDNFINVYVQAGLGFPVGFPVQTLYLFKNGILLIEGTDYALNRNKGQIYLTEELVRGDVLVAGSVDSRTHISTIPLNDADTFVNQYFWLVADADVTQTAICQPTDVITHSYNPSTKLMSIGSVAGRFADVETDDWIVMWDSALGGVWTKRVESRGANSVYVEAESDLFPSGNRVLADGGIRVFRTTGVPQKVELPSTYSSVSNLVTSINQKLSGLHAVADGNKIRFYTDSFKEEGAVAYLTGTKTVTETLGFSQIQVTQTSNPANYQTSLVSGNTESSIEGDAVFATPSTTLPDIGKISRFVEDPVSGLGEQVGLRTTQSTASSYRVTLNGGVIDTDLRKLSSGFHLSDTDKISIKVDGDSSRVFTFPMSIDAKIVGTTLTAQDGTALPYTADGYTFNDWAIWSASSQVATPLTGQSNNITFTSKKYGYSNPIRRVLYSYPPAAGQSINGYEVVSGIMYVTLPSGADISVPGIDPTQRLWLGNYNTGGSVKTMDIVCRFSGLAIYAGVPLQTTIRVPQVNYPNLDSVIQNGDYLFVKNATTGNNIANFDVIEDVTVDAGDFVITLKDESGVMQGGNVLFSVSRNPTPSAIASFDGVVFDSYMHSDAADNTYRIVSVASDKLVFASDEQVPRWLGSYLTFFHSNNTQPTTLSDNPYFSLSTTPAVTVTRSSSEIFNFDIPPEEGEVFVEGAVNYVNVGGGNLVVSKVDQSYDGFVRFVPVTAKNVADCISYNMQGAGVSCFANAAGELELIRTESGADASVQISSGSANSFSLTVTDIGPDYCRVFASDSASLVVGHSVKMTDGDTEENLVISSIIAEDKEINKITFVDDIVGDYTLANTKLVALGKLEFPTEAQATNSDGYKYYSGLLGEVNKVIYGDPTDPVNYPGYASANANIEVTAPQVKQVFLNIFVRMQSGFTLSEAKLAIRNAAAAAVNATPVGQDVAYSDVISAVNAINGVFAVAIEKNTTDNPTIPVLSYEKPLIIDLEKDINVTITGI